MARQIAFDAAEARQGLLGLVVAVLEVVQELLKAQAVRRMRSGSLNGEALERVGQALLELERVLEDFKREQDLHEAVASVRQGLDGLADRLLEPVAEPEGWQ